MVGTDPSIPGTGTTNIAVELIAVSLNFSAVNLVISSTGPACADTIPIVERVVNSPVFANNPWTDVTGSINIGNVQFGDAFQRMNFWAFVSSQSPNYHVNLQPVTVENPISVDVPPGIGATLIPSPTCPSQMIGAIPSSLMDSAVQNAISAMNITPDTLPIFLTYDISFVPENFLGYHKCPRRAELHRGELHRCRIHRSNRCKFSVAVLTHEVGEWLDDPFLSNNVPPWGELAYNLLVVLCLRLVIHSAEVSSPFKHQISIITFRNWPSCGGSRETFPRSQSMVNILWRLRSPPRLPSVSRTGVTEPTIVLRHNNFQSR